MNEPKLSEEGERLIMQAYATAYGHNPNSHLNVWPKFDALRARMAILERRIETAEDSERYYRREWESACERLECDKGRISELEAAKGWRPIAEYNLGCQPVLTSRLIALGKAVEVQFPPFKEHTTHFRPCPKGASD